MNTTDFRPYERYPCWPSHTIQHMSAPLALALGDFLKYPPYLLVTATNAPLPGNSHMIANKKHAFKPRPLSILCHPSANHLIFYRLPGSYRSHQHNLGVSICRILFNLLIKWTPNYSPESNKSYFFLPDIAAIALRMCAHN